MSESIQKTVFGEQIEEQVRIETTGRVIRPFKRVLDTIAGEYKLHFDSDGITVEVVDPANVYAGCVTLEADAFETYELENETTFGISARNFGSALQHARYGKDTDDPIAVTGGPRHLETEVEREFGDTPATVNERVELTDPNSLRSQPDIPDLDLDVEVDLDPTAFTEVIGALDTDKDYLKLGSNIDSIVFNQDSNSKRNIRLDADPSNVSEWTLFSGSYMKQIRTALRDSYATELTLRWGEDLPLFAEFESETMHGTLMLAPRIQSGEQ